MSEITEILLQSHSFLGADALLNIADLNCAVKFFYNQFESLDSNFSYLFTYNGTILMRRTNVSVIVIIGKEKIAVVLAFFPPVS